ncbi:hypothetical protein IE077_001413 [Cardiosporidium cionae]|uniref:Gfo/Idh/MocA-like oxidoreductase N-terminal domain-containing protein n=1 Tax=Cardiosporidium cionae TaxID=476202 RepID=A0ABQ7JCY1_9APIC|nr:hypothetical protein IE077_001413 [Cardiosporidium cionae]|eukprot:KAF8821882.1 hypothetical protein IE077_001413 [Cardiosporidium cionae]
MNKFFSKDSVGDLRPINVLMCGSGEYTTGYVEGEVAAPDKRKGVVGLVLFDLKRRGFVGNLSMCGVNGTKFPNIRKHFKSAIEESYAEMDTSFISWPGNEVCRDEFAYKRAIDALRKGDGITIYTPDDAHFNICLYAIQRGIHCIIAKPAVLKTSDHFKLIEAARKYNVLVMIEFHKRWDMIYADARQRIRLLGEFSYWYSYMSQPQSQLKTFKKWAGISSDISFYLNSHHLDLHCWSMKEIAIPTHVWGFSANGVATNSCGCASSTEDTITVSCQWKNLATDSRGVAVYTASWIAPNNAEVHSQQRFSCLCRDGEVRVNQAHRGYEVTTHNHYATVNPFYMKYTPDESGYFNGQRGYGYIPFEQWIRACQALNTKETTLEELNQFLPTIENTVEVTAILEAGRQSIDKDGERMDVQKLIEDSKREAKQENL